MDDVLGERPVTNVKNALQGSMPGLMVSGGASPGEAKASTYVVQYPSTV